MRSVICPECGVIVKLNSEGEVHIHYAPTDPEEDTYDLPCEFSGMPFEDEEDEEDEEGYNRGKVLS